MGENYRVKLVGLLECGKIMKFNLPVPQYMLDAFPWLEGFYAAVRTVKAVPLPGSHIILGSDYGGNSGTSKYLSYVFVLSDEDNSSLYPSLQQHVRSHFLPDGRRMSFKQLGDRKRRDALMPFLESAEALSGICIAILVHKDFRFVTTTKKDLDIWRTIRPTAGKWTIHAFETMARIVHFAAILVSICACPLHHLCWITAEDEIVANKDRLVDVIEFTVHVIGRYVPFQL